MARSCVVSIVLTALLGLLPLTPPEHVHEVTAPDGHHEVIAHHHAQLHTGIPERHDGSVIDHDDADAVSLEAVYIGATSYVLFVPADVFERTALPNRGDGAQITSAPLVEPLIHAPPRAPASLRAPPFPTSL